MIIKLYAWKLMSSFSQKQCRTQALLKCNGLGFTRKKNDCWKNINVKCETEYYMAPIASKSSVFQWLAFYGTFTNNSLHISVWPTLESKVSIHLLLLFCHGLNCVPEEAQVPTRFSLIKIVSLYHLLIKCLLWFINSSFKMQTTCAENKQSPYSAYSVLIFNMLSNSSCSEEERRGYDGMVGMRESKMHGTSGYGLSGRGLTPGALTGTSVSTLTSSQVVSTNGRRKH